MPGSVFYKQASAMGWQQRDSFVLREFYAGNLPDFIKQLHPVRVTFHDSVSATTHVGVFYVTPDYFSIGTNDDWVRIPITPMVAKEIADKLKCFLPTRKMVDDIYKSAAIKLDPMPMYAFRDSTPTMYHHHLIIEGQRKGRNGLIAGIKKDIVSSSQLKFRPDRVAIYGWHKPDGKPIQPLYLGHVNWYVDYSHGIRLVSRRIFVDGKMMDYTEVLNHPVLKNLLCDETDCTPVD
ncbi:MAG: hypothetical protein EOO04_17805 [Chitinophagaceae bacterium]|nr:MAG: hypothetical protein EOO04_17805 [Chitinophagaceae bacterium]